MIRSASARYEGLGKDGKGHVSTQSGVLSDQQYGFNTRFEDGKGTNPEDLIAAGAKAGCPISKLLNAEITLEHHLTA